MAVACVSECLLLADCGLDVAQPGKPSKDVTMAASSQRPDNPCDRLWIAITKAQQVQAWMKLRVHRFFRHNRDRSQIRQGIRADSVTHASGCRGSTKNDGSQPLTARNVQLRDRSRGCRNSAPGLDPCAFARSSSPLRVGQICLRGRSGSAGRTYCSS